MCLSYKNNTPSSSDSAPEARELEKVQKLKIHFMMQTHVQTHSHVCININGLLCWAGAWLSMRDYTPSVRVVCWPRLGTGLEKYQTGDSAQKVATSFLKFPGQIPGQLSQLQGLCFESLETCNNGDVYGLLWNSKIGVWDGKLHGGVGGWSRDGSPPSTPPIPFSCSVFELPLRDSLSGSGTQPCRPRSSL